MGPNFPILFSSSSHYWTWTWSWARMSSPARAWSPRSPADCIFPGGPDSPDTERLYSSFITNKYYTSYDSLPSEPCPPSSRSPLKCLKCVEWNWTLLLLFVRICFWSPATGYLTQVIIDQNTKASHQLDRHYSYTCMWLCECGCTRYSLRRSMAYINIIFRISRTRLWEKLQYCVVEIFVQAIYKINLQYLD